MKILLVLIFLTTQAFAVDYKVYIQKTKNGYTPIYVPDMPKTNSEMKGVGVDMTSRVEIENGKYYVSNRNCGRVLIGDINDEKEKNKEKLQKLSEGEYLKFKFESYSSCVVSDWQKM